MPQGRSQASFSALSRVSPVPRPLAENSSHGQILAMAPAVQQTLDAIAGRRLLLGMVFGHFGQAEGRGDGGVSKNARSLDTMTMTPITYGYARVSKVDNDSKTPRTWRPGCGSLMPTASTDRPGCRDLMSRVQLGDTIAVAFLDRFSRNFMVSIAILPVRRKSYVGRAFVRSRLSCYCAVHYMDPVHN